MYQHKINLFSLQYLEMVQKRKVVSIKVSSVRVIRFSVHSEFNIVGSTEVPSKAFLLFFLFSDWLKSNHLKSRIELGFLDISSRHICSTVTETIRVTNYATSFGAKKCSENQVRSG